MIRIVTVYGNDTVTISIIYRHYLFLCVRRVKSKLLSLENVYSFNLGIEYRLPFIVMVSF